MRQIFVMLLGFFTVRLVLNVLGAEDYGIYHVIAGFVVMLGFLNNTMSASSQRYFSFELGRGNHDQLKKIFNIIFLIYVLITIVFIILAESVGLWFVNNRLSIPIDRLKTAQWIYQFSVLSFVFTLMAAPYMAIIMSHEDMNIYALITIIETVLKLCIAFFLRFDFFNKLQLYGALLCIVSFISMIFYLIFCKVHYQECSVRFYWNKKLFKEIINYTIFDTLSAVAFICKTQGITILLNQFFNPIVVAARSIANSVQNLTVYFSYNFSIALRPQIIKNYAAGEKTEMFNLVSQGTKGTYFLMYLFVFPAILETPQLLLFWLKNPPDYAVGFSRLLLIDTLIQSVGYPLEAAVQATGRIRLYRLIYFFFYVLNLPLSGLSLSIGASAYSVYIIAIFLTFIVFIIQLFAAAKVIPFSISSFFKNIILPLAGTTILSAILPTFLCFRLAPGFLRMCMTASVSFLLTCGCMFAIGLNNNERERVVTMLKKIYSKRGLKWRR
jgi:O-antigen/teichoic acid export membrane protein